MDAIARKLKNLISNLANKGTRMVPETRSGSNGLILYGEDSPTLTVNNFLLTFHSVKMLTVYQVINLLLAEKSNNTVAMLKSVEEIKSALHRVYLP